MSTSPPEPENAAPVRPEQVHESAQTSDQNNARLTAARRSPSSSLLSRLFSSSHQVDESNTAAAGPGEVTETVVSTDSSCQAVIEGNNPDDIKNPDARHPMATTIPPAKLPALSVEASPINMTHDFDLSHIRQANSFLTGHRDLFNSKRGRGTSLERTQKEKRIQDFSKSVFSINPGDTGTINSPAPRSPATSITSSDNPLLDGVRANYRSWRDTHPGMAAEKAWSIGEQASGKVPEGQVEKSIVEALAGIEPNNRQRKSSHSLRFFKEGLPDEKPKKREPKDGGRSKEKLPRMKDLTPSDIRNGDENHDGRPSDRTTDGVASSSHGTSPRQDGISQVVEGYIPPQSSQTQVDQRFDTLSTQVLDDFPKEHNPAPAQGKGPSFPRSLPVSELGRDKPSSKPQEAYNTEAPKSESGENRSGTKDEDDESGEEQISSALFVPHKTSHDPPGCELLDSGDQDHSGSSTNRSGPGESEGWLVEHTIPARSDDEIRIRKATTLDVSGATGDYTPDQEHENYPSDPLQGPDLTYDTASETGYSTKDEESGFTDDAETTPTGRINGKQFMSQNHKDHLHHHQQVAKAPLEAIELIPYRHQVGGHTTMWRFSRRAVCKQLNNRENEFYERIERHHPKLLKFMPRYIGVLNVTFEKQQRRKTSTRENGATPEGDVVSPGLSGHSNGYALKDTADRPTAANGDDRRVNPPRLVSQSISSGPVPTPTVTFADNRHIIPKSFLQPSLQTQEAVRRYLSESNAKTALSPRRSSQSQPPPSNSEFTFRPTLSDKHAVSWGATTVNKKLRNEVFGEAFLQQPIPIQRHRRPAHRPLTHRSGQPSNLSQLRTSSSESNLIGAQEVQGSLLGNNNVNGGSLHKEAVRGAAERNGLTSLTSGDSAIGDRLREPGQNSETPASDGNTPQFEEKVGTSVPAPDLPLEPYKAMRKRRYSSGSLHRKPDNDAEDRGNLKDFEEADVAGYKGVGEADVFQMDSEVTAPRDVTFPGASEPDKPVLHPAVQASEPPMSPPESEAIESIIPLGRDQRVNGILPMPRPVNPKEAQTQRDKRVEFFLLLEDLTAGMKRPCIMDLKMGTRQYGVDANEKKQNSQRRKCAETTSKELGVRVCGLQVWDIATQSYIFKDKYFGRKLKAGREFQDALQRFLYDGVDYASVLRHIPTILHKLSQLEILIKDLRGYRFYAASLLMFYDGEVDDGGTATDTSVAAKESKIRRREIDFKIADFANCVTAESGPGPVKQRACPPQHPEEPDKGFLRGLRSLRRYFVDIQKEIVETERRRGVNFDVQDDIIINGRGLANDPLDKDLGEVSY